MKDYFDLEPGETNFMKKKTTESTQPSGTGLWVISRLHADNPRYTRSYTCGSDGSTAFLPLAEIFPNEVKAAKEMQKWGWKDPWEVQELLVEELHPHKVFEATMQALCNHAGVTLMVDEDIRSNTYYHFIEKFRTKTRQKLEQEIVQLKAQLYDLLKPKIQVDSEDEEG